jgi:hypothetical protein
MHTYTSFTYSQRLLIPHLLDSTLQSLEPEIIEIAEPPVSLVLDTDLIDIQINHTFETGMVFLPAVYWVNAAAGRTSRDDHTRP